MCYKILNNLVSVDADAFFYRAMHLSAKRGIAIDKSTPRGTSRNFRPNGGGVLKKRLSAYKSSNISETRQDRTKVTIEAE